MKKAPLTAATLLITIIVTLCGCSQKLAEPQSVQLNRNFSCEMSVEQAGKSFSAEFTSTDGGCTAVFLQPNELKGLTVQCFGSTCTYSMDGLSFSAVPSEKQVLFMSVIFKALNMQASTVSQKEGFLCLDGDADFGHYFMNVNASTLTPTFIEVDSRDLTVRFG